MAEILIVVSILALLAILFLLNAKMQIVRGYDSRRKTDLIKIRIAFEEYYNDHGCYPSADVLLDCGGPGLRPFLAAIPCDPTTRAPYLYVPVTGNTCAGYRACVALGDTNDPDIGNIGCNGITGCGWGTGYNYCISSGVSVIAPGFVPNTPTPSPIPTLSPTPTPVPGPWACTFGGSCNNFGWPNSCPISFSDVGACVSYCPTSPLWMRCI